MNSHEASAPPLVSPVPFRQPKDFVRCLAVVLSVVGWFVSLQLLQVALGSTDANPFVSAVCPTTGDGTEASDCTSVLRSPQGYIALGPNLPRIPVSAVGMAYFAVVGLWFLLVGPPTRPARFWHLAIVVVVLAGAWSSIGFIRIMHAELHRWCLPCLLVHAINGGLLLLTVLAFPWRRSAEPVAPHPSGRLVLAAVVAGFLAVAAHLGLLFALLFGAILGERTQTYAAVLNDPAFIRWDYERQPAKCIPPRDGEVYIGPADAPETVVVFSEFQCPRCRSLHDLLEQVVHQYPDRVRITFRHYPNDAECNPHVPLGGAHTSACRAARAVEAAQIVGGAEECLALRRKLWEKQAEIPRQRLTRQADTQAQVFTKWATETGLDQKTFQEAFEGPVASARLEADVELGHRLGIVEVPTVYLNGRLVRNAQKMETWDVLLGGASATDSQPASAPAEP